MSNSKIPDGWTQESVGSLANTFAGGTPNRMRRNLFGGGVPWVKSTEVNLRRIDRTTESLTRLGLDSSAAKWVKPNTPLVALYGATAGVVGWLGIRATTNQAVLAVEPEKGVHPRWLYWALSNSTRQILASVQGSGQPNLSKAIVDRAKILTPDDPEEQRRIAEILDTADEAIQKTEALIAKLKQMKAGLLHDLLTRGIDENGELRTSNATESDGWQFRDFFEVVSIPNGQVSPLAEPYRNWQLIAPDHINVGDGELITRKTAFELGAISGKYVVEPGDVVYSKIRPYLRKAVLATNQALCSADMYPLTSSEDTDPRFLHALILGEKFSRYASIVSVRSGFPKINRSELGAYKFFIPGIDEQSRIADRIDAQKSRIIKETKVLAKLKKLKAGLMHDLLTGNKRVNVAEPVTA